MKKWALLYLAGLVLAFLEPELMNVASVGVKLINESLQRPNLGRFVVGGLVSVAAFAAALEKHPELLNKTR